ncbi:MAG TPA: LysR family transcriptional regulator [Chromatiales bacterium]|nr:LysR family transcriptional regulator [Thiotrichales bacterium]HIP69557.1 LysR family transcriptional regulator [Chromatiales bacterium]
MELRQLKSLITLVESDFSVSRAADKRHLVQSAVSQQLSRLEDELGSKLFIRRGKRLTGLTTMGEEVLLYAHRIMANTHSIRDIGREQVKSAKGILRVATTHTQARYVLPEVIKRFTTDFPDVELEIHQGTPEQLVEMAIKDRVDISICTEALSEHPDLNTIPCYSWNRSVILYPSHPLASKRRITLKQLCEYPIITYVFGFTGRGHFSKTFQDARLSPRVVLSAADTDVIKTYVREGLGVGIIASMAYTPDQDSDLLLKDLSHIFPWEVTKIAYLKDKYLRGYQQHFIDLFQEFVESDGEKTGLMAP